MVIWQCDICKSEFYDQIATVSVSLRVGKDPIQAQSRVHVCSACMLETIEAAKANVLAFKWATWLRGEA